MTPAEIKKWIFDRCEECGDCLLWKQAVDDAGVPVCRLPGGKVLQARRVLMQALGRDIDGKIATTSCNHKRCMAPEHVAAWTRKALQVRTVKATGFPQRLSRRAAIAESRRKTAVLDMDKVLDMRARKLTGREAAAEFGVALSTAQKALAGDSWADYASPFAGLGARP